MNKDDLESEELKEIGEDLSDLSDSLGKQIRYEMDGSNDSLENEEEPIGDLLEEKKKLPKWAKISIGAGGGVLLIILVIVLYFNGLLNKINYFNGNVDLQDETFDNDELSGDQQEINPDDVDWAKITARIKKEGVINILLAGEEAMADGINSRGRADAIMIATVNIEQKSLKLTSIMRDTYVQIPGYSDNKLNSAYKTGGMPLLLETIETNFNIGMDGYVLVDFNSFETIIDKLGGVNITLSANEAHYLNTTNYISNPKYRNVKEGLNKLNGNQALGYSRIRYVKTIDNVRDDFGRTSRQRTVLNAIFEKYKSKNIIEIGLLLNDILPLVTTNIHKDDIINYLTAALSLGATDIQTFRIPVDNGYTNARIRTMSVLLPDLATNVRALHEFIFGESDLVVIPSTVPPVIDKPATPVPTKTPEATVTPTPVMTKKPEQTKAPIIDSTEEPIATEEPKETIMPNETQTPEEENVPQNPPEPTSVPTKTTAPAADVPAPTTNPDTSNSIVLDDNN